MAHVAVHSEQRMDVVSPLFAYNPSLKGCFQMRYYVLFSNIVVVKGNFKNSLSACCDSRNFEEIKTYRVLR